ncbi:unnamed protein product [Paramecium sonneborni]|uniref:TLDc domain-containing protein n=1 Tax=Paramecium sonneborni TaxID=65129 RepID=A0A8S1RIT4_9CILI|nr:unnamed protein product [Paramecium sonneborni]
MKSLIPCQKHEGSYLHFIIYSKQKAEYLCELCQLELDNSEVKNDSQLIHIRSAFNSSEYLLSKLNLDTQLNQYFTELDEKNEKKINNILQDLKVQIKNLQNNLQAIEKELDQHQKCFLDKKKKIKNRLNLAIQFDQFKQFILNLQQLGDAINPQAIEENEKKLHQYFQDLKKNDSKDLNQTVENILIEILQPKDQMDEQYPQIKKLEEQLQLFRNSQIEFQKQIRKMNDGTRIRSILLLRSFSRKVENQISSKLNKIILSLQQVYFSSSDGLNGQTFWNKINGKSNLLMIFKSKSGNIFGGFSPCQWQLNLNNYVQDNSLSSFLFSQTHDQIYPLKEAHKQYAIYCNSTHIPCFGYNGDLYIYQDLNQGHSTLGISYQWDQYQNLNPKSSHLYGQITPNIQECEIYQVIFS